ncbi:AAA family ATPase [Streptomyces hebeiensis]
MGNATVRSINPSKGLEEFCYFLYGEEEAFIHLPVKNPETEVYEYNFFFKWPSQKQDVIDHVERYSKTSEVFITPGMFKTRSSNVTESHGSYVAWADFDGNVPALEDLEELGIPVPTVRVQSSVPGREHWYWRYTQFNKDIVSIQGINKAICYALEGDTGAWDAGHSTRPVGSYNHKRNAPVILISHNTHSYHVDSFSSVPVPEESYNLEQFLRESIPNPVRTIAKHGPWSDDALDLLVKYQIPEGSRSSALARFTYTCCEQGLDNSEVYSLLQWVDKRWKKFYNRSNKEKYYVDLINYARQKIPYQGIKDVTVLADEIPTFSFKEVLEYVDDTEWIINGLLPYKGIAYLVGRSGTGKTTLGLGMCTYLALNKKYLDWESSSEKQYKTLYLSLEMSMEDVNDFYKKISLNFTTPELNDLDKHIHTYASPEKIKFYQPGSPIMGRFLRKLENLKPDIVFVDSASYSLASNLNNQEEVTKSVELLDMIKDRYGCTFIFIHHSRKDPPNSGYREADLDDVFGSTFIAASASSIIALKNNKEYSDTNRLMDIRYLKTRFRGDNTGFSVTMDGERRMFRRPIMGELMAKSTVKTETKNESSNESRSFFQH